MVLKTARYVDPTEVIELGDPGQGDTVVDCTFGAGGHARLIAANWGGPAQYRVLPKVDVGDLVAIRDAGAYGAVMASNYNRRPFPAEVLVDGGAWRVIRRRQTVDDMLSLEGDS